MNKKILFAPIHYILDKDAAGSEFSWAYEIYKRFDSKKDLNTFFITGGTRGISAKHVISCAIFNPKSLNLSLFNILKFYVQIFLETKKIVENQNIDIIHHAFPYAINHSFNLYAIFSTKKFIIGPIQSGLTVHDTDISSSDALGFSKNNTFSIRQSIDHILISCLHPLMKFLSYLTTNKAAYLIAVNDYTKKLLIKNGVAAKRIVIIPPGIDSKKFTFTSFATKSNTIYEILCVGHLRKRKGVELVIQGLSRVVKVKKNVRLRIIGDGPQKRALHEQVRKLNMEKYVIFEGFVPYEQIATYYAKAHMFVCMSRSEAFATISLEAMASGLAVVSSKVGGFEDIIKHGKNGYLVNQEDEKDMGNRIIQLLSNIKQMKNFGIEARKTIEISYDWENVIMPQYVKLYAAMLK